MEPLEINGDAPPLAGLRCDAIHCVEYWHAGHLVEPANVVSLCFGGTWHRLYFDYGVIFWRHDEGGPVPFEAPELDASYRVVEVAAKWGLLGQRLSHYEMAPIEGGSCVTLLFENEKMISFSNIDDITSYQVP